MRTIRFNMVGALLGLLLACRAPGSSAFTEARADEAEVTDGSGSRTVVVELFTSEGCSSCPPADAVLAGLAADPRVVALSFHVDYWDELGWPDPFSSPENTARQRAYATSFGSRSMYTPQLIVGGVDGVVGGSRSQAETDIAGELAKVPAATLSIKVQPSGDGWVTVDTAPSGAPSGSFVNVALVQRSATSAVRAGENAGRTLRHVDVVRGFATATGAGPSKVRLAMPRGLSAGEAQIVAFIQTAGNGGRGMPILVATRAMLPRP